MQHLTKDFINVFHTTINVTACSGVLSARHECVAFLKKCANPPSRASKTKNCIYGEVTSRINRPFLLSSLLCTSCAGNRINHLCPPNWTLERYETQFARIFKLSNLIASSCSSISLADSLASSIMNSYFLYASLRMKEVILRCLRETELASSYIVAFGA